MGYYVEAWGPVATSVPKDDEPSIDAAHSVPYQCLSCSDKAGYQDLEVLQTEMTLSKA